MTQFKVVCLKISPYSRYYALFFSKKKGELIELNVLHFEMKELYVNVN